ncbi:MAG TPA: DUF6624 domain-containing protein [Azospirillaceae bacterium]|nr:DUF6624 domain-containing protein [Azospirillaceae bacterium]
MRALAALATMLMLAAPSALAAGTPLAPEELVRRFSSVAPGLVQPACRLEERSCVEGLLRTARDLDQEARSGMVVCRPVADPVERAGCLKPYLTTTRGVDEVTTGLLKRIVALHGWPGGPGWSADTGDIAWLLAQHADHDRPFQREALGLLRTAVDEGRAKAKDYALLSDRVALGEGKPQRYGTQGGCKDGTWRPAELEDPARVDEFRTGMGLVPLAEYADRFRDVCARLR